MLVQADAQWDGSKTGSRSIILVTREITPRLWASLESKPCHGNGLTLLRLQPWKSGGKKEEEKVKEKYRLMKKERKDSRTVDC